MYINIKPLEFIHQWLPSFGWTTLCSAIIFLLRFGWRARGKVTEILNDWTSFRKSFDICAKQMNVVATNHLEHIQKSTETLAREFKDHATKMEKAIEVQAEVSRTQNEVLVDLKVAVAELNGFLKGQASSK